MKNITSKIINTTLVISAVFSLNGCGHQVLPLQNTMMNPTQEIQTYSAQKQIIVKFNPNATRHALRSFNERFGLRTVKFISGINAYVFEVAQNRGMALNQMLNTMQNEPIVAYAEENLKMQIAPIAEMGISPILK